MTSTTSAQPGIVLRRVAKTYGTTEVLTDVTATLLPGRIYGLLGANGTGKTTLLACIAGHTFRTGGEILIDGQDPVENAAILARLCFVREDQAYNDAFSVADILGVLPSFYTEWDSELATRLVRRFRIPRHTKSKKLSRGQRSALAIVIALASGAAYTFLDEPYLGLDATARGIFYDELLAVYAASHERAFAAGPDDAAAVPRTFVMSTHLIDEAADLLEEVLVIEGGRIALQADLEEAKRTAFIARGLEADVLALAAGRELLSMRRLGGIVSATIRGNLSADERRLAEQRRLSLEPATLQELVAAIGLHGMAAPPPDSMPDPQSDPASADPLTADATHSLESRSQS